MYDLRNLPGSKHLRAACLVLLGALCHVQVNAATATATDDAFQRFMWTTTGANSQSVTYGSGGTPVASPTGSGSIAADGSKSLAYNRNATWRNPSGNTVSGGIGGKIPINAKTAKLLTAGMKALPLLGTGVALWEMATELGYDPLKEPDGSVTVRKKDATVCSTAPCYEYGMRTFSSTAYTIWKSTKQASCDGFAQTYSDRFGAGWVGVVAGDTCTPTKAGSSGVTWNFGTRSVSPSAPVYTPSSMTELEDAIAAKSGWPSSSSLPKAVVDAATATGQKIDIEAPTVTGPATSPGTTKTSTNTGTNTTTTTTTTHNHAYNDNRVTNTITTSVNVTNNSTGTTTTETTTEEPVEEAGECEENPNALNCADLDTPEVDIPKTEKTITFNAENLGFAGGSCPANVTQNINGSPVVLFNWSSHCTTIVNYAKPMILALATFAALMIIFGAKTE